MAIAFPSTLTCVLEDSYSADTAVFKQYLGGKKMYEEDGTISATILLSNDADRTTFYTWYNGACLHGTEEFNIEIPYQSVIGNRLVVFSSTITEVFKGGEYSEISFTLTVLGLT